MKSSSYYIKDDFFDITFNKCLEFTNLYETKNMINKDINKEIMLIYMMIKMIIHYQHIINKRLWIFLAIIQLIHLILFIQ